MDSITNNFKYDFIAWHHRHCRRQSNHDCRGETNPRKSARWEELKTVTEGFVAGCEAGNFSPLKNHSAKKA
jgi:hypothetical protein